MEDDNKRNLSKQVIVFDIGGTWFRSGIINSNGNLIDIKKEKAVNYINTPHNKISELHDALIDYLIKNTQIHLKKIKPTEKNIVYVSVSIGAALNAHTGMIYSSGPLWGPNSVPLNLLSKLRDKCSQVKWIIVNDITAALLYFTTKFKHEEISKIGLLTISTGIGFRTFDKLKNRIPVERTYGLQGEIGHIPIRYYYRGNKIELKCDCGEFNHLNAFCSGRGIEKVLCTIIDQHNNKTHHSSQLLARSHDSKLRFEDFLTALESDDVLATSILDSVTLPVAEILIQIFVIDPEIEKIILTGGVAKSIGFKYLNSLIQHLERIGIYEISKRDPLFFKKRFYLDIKTDFPCLLGAGLAVQNEFEEIFIEKL